MPDEPTGAQMPEQTIPTIQAKTAPSPAFDPANDPYGIGALNLPMGQYPNVWSYKSYQKSGRPVFFAPGCTTAVVRGPTNIIGLLKNARIHLYNSRMEAIRNGYPDPGYMVDESSIKAIGFEDVGTVDQMIEWRPSGSKPITLGIGLTQPTEEAKKAHEAAMEKFLAQQD